MQEYDVTLKLLLRNSAALTTIVNWLDGEPPKIQNLRADLLGETAAGDLLHVELQSTNEASMPLRMAEHWLWILRLTGKIPTPGPALRRLSAITYGDRTQMRRRMVPVACHRYPEGAIAGPETSGTEDYCKDRRPAAGRPGDSADAVADLRSDSELGRGAGRQIDNGLEDLSLRLLDAGSLEELLR